MDSKLETLVPLVNTGSSLGRAASTLLGNGPALMRLLLDLLLTVLLLTVLLLIVLLLTVLLHTVLLSLKTFLSPLGPG